MKRPVLLAALSLLLGCPKNDAPVPPTPTTTPPPTSAGRATATEPAPAPRPAPAPTSAEPPARPAPEREDERRTPSLSLSANGHGPAELPQGWPLVLQATVLGRKGRREALPLDAVGLTVTDATGKKVAWAMKRRARVSELAVDETTGASMAWVVADTASIAPGVYRVSAALAGGAGDSVEVTVVPAPATPTEEQEAERLVIGARASILLDDAAGALARAEERVKRLPRDVLGLRLRAEALAALGRRAEAEAAFERALTQWTLQNPKAEEPPFDLLAEQREVSEAPR